MAERPGILFRFELLDALEQLDPADAGTLFVSAMRYGRYGDVPTFQNPVVSVIWPFVKSAVDRDAESYNNKTAQRRYAVYVREAKRKDESPMSFDEWKVSADIENERSIIPDIHTQIQSQTHTQEQGQEQALRADKPPTPTRKKYGEYGWVSLTDDEYSRLLSDLGQAELDRCIQYIDESAQGNGNKNKWRDWNLVLRRCAREGWGRRNTDIAESPAPRAKKYEIIDGEAVEVTGSDV